MPNADNQDTEVSEPTVNEESVDTSTNEESQEVDMDLEDDDTSFEDVDDDETEDSESENEDTEPTESEEESDVDEQQEEVADEESKEEDTPSEEDIKRHNAEMAQRRIAEKQAREATKQEQQLEYLKEAEDEKDLALRQLQIDAYNNKVTANANSLENGIEKAVASIELFRDGSPEVKEALAQSLDTFEKMHVQYDQYGEPIKVTGDVYEYLQNEANKIQRIIQVGARQQVKDKSKAKARTETIPSKAPKQAKVDPDLAAFDEEIAALM